VAQDTALIVDHGARAAATRSVDLMMRLKPSVSAGVGDVRGKVTRTAGHEVWIASASQVASGGS
jgi:hypothetical protein